MPRCSFQALCRTASFFIIFSVTLVISIFPFYNYLEAECMVKENNPTHFLIRHFESGGMTTCDVQYYAVLVKGELPSYETKAQVHADSETDCEDIRNRIAENDIPCWYSRSDRLDVYVTTKEKDMNIKADIRFYDKMSYASIFLSVVFGLFSILSIVFMFKNHLIRFCPRFVLTTAMNLQAWFRDGHPELVPAHQNYELDVDELPEGSSTAASRRRISHLIETSKLSEEQVKKMYDEGWSCCICLEDGNEDGMRSAVSRLQCGHATHSECLQNWLETGRAVCCLCNTDVFPEDSKGGSSFSDGSGYDAAPPGSLEVERTEGALSSPATSIYIESHSRVAGPSHVESSQTGTLQSETLHSGRNDEQV